MRPPNNINTSRPIQISVDGRDSYIQVDTGGYNLTNDGIECNDPDTSIFIPWKYIQWIEQSTAVDTVFNRQTTHNNTGSSTNNPVITNPASIVDSRDDEIRLLERNNPFARIDMKLFKQCVNNHIIEHDENGWRIRISNQRIGYNEDQAMSVIRSNPSLQVYLAQSLSTIPLSDTDENHANTSASMNTVNNASMNQVNNDNDNKKQSDYTNDPWVTIDDNTANDGMQTLLTVDPQADNEYMLDDYDDNMSYTPEMLIESYNDDTHSSITSTAGSDNTANTVSKTASTMNSKTVHNASTVNNISTSSADADAYAGDSTSSDGANTTASMSNKPTTTRHREQSYAPTEPGFSFGFGFTTNNKNTTTNANNASMSSHDSHEISDVNYNRIITVNNDVHMTAAHMPNAITNASTVNTNADASKLVSSMNSESSDSNGMPVSDTASMQPSSSMMNTGSHVNNSSDYANNSDYIDNNATSPIHPSRKKKNPVKHHLTDYEVDDSSNTDNATTADENGCDWVVLMVALGYAGTIVSRWRSRAEAEADRDARIENNNVNSSMIPLNYMVFRANGNRLYDRKYIPRDKNGIPLKGYNEYGEYVAGLPGYEF